jgi:hypothetical protein
MLPRRGVVELKITRLSADDRVYSISSDTGSRYGMQDFELKRWLIDLGAGDSTIAAVLDAEPHATMTINLSGRAA